MRFTLLSVLIVVSICQTKAQNVGIGINNPFRQLHIHGNANAFTGINLSNNATGSGAVSGMNIGLSFNADVVEQQFGIINVYQNAPLYFTTNNFVRGAFSAAGNFVVGTNTPSL